VDDLLKRDAFQRACVQFVQKRGSLLCGRISDHAVVFLAEESRKGAGLRAELSEVAQRVTALARRFGLGLSFGVSSGDDQRPLPARFQAALAASEEALSRGLSLVQADPEGNRSGASLLAAPRREFVAAIARGPGALVQRFDRYREAVAMHTGYRLEPTRAHLEASLGQVMDALRADAVLDDRSLTDLESALDHAAAESRTIDELYTAYGAVVVDIESALSHPTDARVDRSVRRATAFVREHFAESLSVARVARVAGFAPSYFSKVFLRSEGMTLPEHVRHIRLERAKYMLLSTDLRAERVGRLCGFSNRTHFHRAFRRQVGMAPLEYRTRNAGAADASPTRRRRHRSNGASKKS
jgi:AraC-like DNA-binding protein